MAKTKSGLNLGTRRASDDVLQPAELPTQYAPGSRAIAPWASIVDSTRKPDHLQERILCGGSGADLTNTPDTHEIESQVAHSKVQHGPQAKTGTRENFGGGARGARKDKGLEK